MPRLSAEEARARVGSRRKEMDRRAREILDSSTTPDRTVKAGSSSKKKKKSTQKHTITAPNPKNKRKHYGKPFDEGN